MPRWLTYKVPVYWVALAGLLALAASVGWWLALRPAAAEWGTVSSWVATGGGLVALTFTGRQLRLVLTQRRQAMGDSVAVILEKLPARTSAKLRMTCINAGQFAVHGVKAQTATFEGSEPRESAVYEEPPGGILVPGQSVVVTFELNDAQAILDPSQLGAILSFKDIEGRFWRHSFTLDGRRLSR